MSTGNGIFDPATLDWGDSVFALNADGTGSGGSPIDSYTPSNYVALDDQDLDLGSTAPAILPAPATSIYQHLAVQSGKDAKLRLINLDNLSNSATPGPGHVGGEIGPVIDVPQGGEVLTQPAVWVNPADNVTWVFIANGYGISGLKLTVNASGIPSLQTGWQTSGDGTSPIIANGVLYYASSNDMRALNPTTGAQLWHDTTIGGIHWESPIVANGTLYITDESRHLSAYALPSSSTPTDTAIAPTPTNTSVASTQTPTSTATKTPGPPTATATQAAASTATRTATPTPTATQTGTPISTTPTQLVVNGDFEHGTTGWTFSSSSNTSIIDTTLPHSPTHDAQLCPVNNCLDSMTQTVTLPASSGQIVLSYWVGMATQDLSPTCADQMLVQVKTMTGTVITTPQQMCSNVRVGGYNQQTYDLTSALAPYAGQQVQLSFTGQSNASAPTTWYIDDVSLVAKT